MRRLIFPLLFGLCGVAVLLALGTWQLRRLEWKESVLARIEAQLTAAPGPLPAPGAGDPAALKYSPVAVAGRTTGEELLVLSGRKGMGAGYEVIAAFETSEGRRILLDRGIVPEAARRDPRPATALAVTGNLHWPDEATAQTPPPDAATGLWFARDVAAMAAALGTEPLMVVAREIKGEAQGITPVPVDTSGIPNDHLGYAITWFLLAAVWAGMTAYLLWRITRKTI